jgi:predicted ATP-binding protein involved in virulence
MISAKLSRCGIIRVTCMTEPSADTNKKSTPVYFASIEVENVLCFRTPQKLDLCDANGFPTQWTVILGDNGVGKTTLLRCIAGMKPFYIDQMGIVPKLFMYTTWQETFFDRFSQPSKIIANFLCGKSLNNWNDNLLNKKIEVQSFKKAKLELREKVSAFSGIGRTAYDMGKPLGIQCYGYGANRKAGKTSLSETLSSDSMSSLFLDNDVLINAEEWLLKADYAVVRSDPKNNIFKKRFELVKQTLQQLLPDINDIRISPATEQRSSPTAEFLTPYGWVPISSLGLGYRTVIAWIVDLSARMIDRYPDSENPLAEPAVVLVDEIDLHLHPKWQRTIMSFLTERFPNVQFIVTAHSPLVVQAARNANLVLLRREGDHVVIDNNPEIIENWRVEQVLTSVFELPSTLPADIEPLVQRRHTILAKSSLTKKDKQELKELEAKIGNLPAAESAADIRAMDIIRKAAKLLENR